MYGQNGFSDWFCGGFGFMPGPFGMIFTILLWVAVITVTVKILQSLFFSGKQSRSSDSLKILKDRYAAGEITKDEFEQIKRDIT
jgi:putative membrane protein